MGQHADLRDRGPVRHGLGALGDLQSQRPRRLGERLLRRERRGRRTAAPGHPPLHGARHRRAARPPPHAGCGGRRVQGSPRSQLLVRAGTPACRSGAPADGLPPAVGPEGVLGHQGRHQHRVAGPCGRPCAAKGPGRRRRVRPSDADPLLRPARRLPARRADRPDRRPRLPLPPARGHGPPPPSRPPIARRRLLARSSSPGRGRVPCGHGDRPLPRRLDRRRAAGSPRGPKRALRRRPARVVLHVPLPVAEVLPRGHRGPRRDRDSGRRRGVGGGDALARALAAGPPLQRRACDGGARRGRAADVAGLRPGPGRPGVRVRQGDRRGRDGTRHGAGRRAPGHSADRRLDAASRRPPDPGTPPLRGTVRKLSLLRRGRRPGQGAGRSPDRAGPQALRQPRVDRGAAASGARRHPQVLRGDRLRKGAHGADGAEPDRRVRSGRDRAAGQGREGPLGGGRPLLPGRSG